MAINLDNAVSDRTLDKLNKHDNKPETEPGFEGGIDFSDFFDDYDDLDLGGGNSGDNQGTNGSDAFGTSSNGSGFGDFGSNNSFGSNGFGTSGTFGSTGGFGGLNSGFGGLNSGFGGLNSGFGGLNSGFGQQPAQPPKKDVFDTAVEFTSDALKASGGIFSDFVKSIKTKCFDDIVSTIVDWMIFGAVTAGIGILFKIIAFASNKAAFGELGGSIIGGGAISLGIGAIGFGISTMKVMSKGAPTEKAGALKDSEITLGDSKISDDVFEDAYADLLDDYLDENNDSDSFGDFDFGSTQSSVDNVGTLSFEDEAETEEEPIDNASRIDALATNSPRLDRKFLVENLGRFFPENAKGFSETRELHSGEQEYDTIRALIFQALAEASKTDLEELDTEIVSITSSMFCYVIVCERCKGLSKTDDIKREVESYFREDAEDVSVSASVTIEHGNYKIVITKGASDVITIGDCLQLSTVKDFFMNEKNKLPFVAGIDQYGTPILADAKHYATMLIAGKPRSGKSWFVNSIIVPIASFNTPEDVEFICIDPKKSNLFKTIACLPHVIGLHDDSNIIQLLTEIIDVEGERRKKILSDNRCDNIWDLRDRKGVKLPILILVIDEYMTVKANLEQNGMYKEFEELFNMLITQLPFVGIHLMFVPHRAQGVVTKTTRSMIMFSAAVRADNAIVAETLDEKKWDRPLTKPGDAALKLSDTGITKYIRTAAIATSDADNMTLIEDIAKAWYRMGVDIPDNRQLRVCCNRDEIEIAEILGINASDVTHVQYGKNSMSSKGMSDRLFSGVDSMTSSSMREEIIEDEEPDIDDDWMADVEKELNGTGESKETWVDDVSVSALFNSDDWKK